MKPQTNQPKRSNIISFKQLAIVTILDGLFFSLVGPASANSLIIIVGCGLLALGVYVWTALAVQVIAAFKPIEHRSQRVLVIFCVVVLMLLILMQSIGQLSWRDVLAIVPLAIGLYLYLSYRTGQPTRQ